MADDNQNLPNEITLDFQRVERIGMGEAVYCQHKSIEQLITIIENLREAHKSMLFTRLYEKTFAALNQALPNALEYDKVSRTGIYYPPGELAKTIRRTEVAIVTGGSSDVPVAREAARALAFAGEGALEINDVGVAGLWRLQSKLGEIETKKVVICVAGMDAALPTVLGGLIPSVIIAVPSSVGYGMAEGGRTALHSLLCSCAPGLVVVNIDNGYGAACAAQRYLSQIPDLS